MNKCILTFAAISLLALGACSTKNSSSSSLKDEPIVSSSKADEVPSSLAPVESSSSISSSSSSNGAISSSSSSSLSSSSSSSSSNQGQNVVATIMNVKSACKAISGQLNEAGYVVGSTTFKIKAKILAVIDSVATKKYYNVSNRYKAFVQDNSGTMYAAIDEAFYKKVKDYIGQESTVYTMEGRIARYYDQPELVVSQYIFENVSLGGLSPLSSFESASFTEVKEELASMHISDKGITYGRPIVFEATYIDELVQENLLFSDGVYTMQLHGSSKISNGFNKGSSYKVAALLSLFNWKPSLTYIGTVGNGATVSSLPIGTPMSAQSEYGIKYTKDKALHSANYENEFYTPHTFEGYVSSYLKDDSVFLVLDDLNSRAFGTYQQAINAKTLFVNNDTEKGINSNAKAERSFLYEFVGTETKVSLTYIPYLLNTSGYWMVFVDPASLTVID